MEEQEGKGREGKGREGKGREGKGREGKGREGKGREGKGREGKGREGKGREGKGREGKRREEKREEKRREEKRREEKRREEKRREEKRREEKRRKERRREKKRREEKRREEKRREEKRREEKEKTFFSMQIQITAMCWGVAHAYQALFNTIRKPEGSGNKKPDTTTSSAPPAKGTAVERGNQTVSISVAPIHKKKTWKQKSACLEREDERAGPSQGEEEEQFVDEMETTRCLSLSELQHTRKDFSRRPVKHVVTRLLRCWDNGASSLELEGKEAKQLGSISREGGADKAIGKGEPVLSLWR
ncbi:hypothetical protein QYF61_013197 [Mycteria americana]|uniref:Uncharacterized protein n=1 Tax=Mycteria americana TaxID=33587 RepID=A0AAN7S7E6_MYCAM|nr:hypothetical protein QYF61_013197 [Mycteria americana]